jgi:hypothetical protein
MSFKLYFCLHEIAAAMRLGRKLEITEAASAGSSTQRRLFNHDNLIWAFFTADSSHHHLLFISCLQLL